MTKKKQYEYVAREQKYRKRLKDRNGKMVALYGDTPRELEYKISDFLEEQAQKAEDAKNPMAEDYAQEWLELHCASLSFGSRKDYQSVLDNYIKPHLEDLRLAEVRPADIKRIIGSVASKSESAHNKTYMLLKRIFTTAFDEGVIPTNPCPQMHNGGKEPAKKVSLTDEQVDALLKAVKGTRVYVFCMIGLYAGLRQEEILGLKWDCVILDATPRIIVNRALRHEHNRPVISETLKSPAARRVIPIPTLLADCLREERDKSTSEFVIANTSGGPLSGSQARKLWMYVKRRTVGDRTYYRYVDGEKTLHTVDATLGADAKRGKFKYTIDFDVTSHLLRHTYISNLLMAGVDIKTVQYLAGHEKSKTTLDIYAHLTYNKPEQILPKVRDAFPTASLPADR